ncbi:unnamed protein product [Ceutorhynchus assimilis]|uniref:Golgin subfamily A member 1 n=1 Tax=Ceutorhynchus assimilis TaxID=467358 RepID=A0A9N9QRK5_9CUCU|nr:unnamed protein product [Ceutorhynchus assimilis]
MFASLKNKIREETGSDFSKLTAKITSTTVQKIDNLRGKSHQGSSSSLNSIVSSDGFREDGPIEPEEFRRRIAKIELEFSRKLEQKEHDWQDIVKEKDRRLQNFDKEKDEAYKQISNLKEALRNAEDLKQKILEHKENSDQMENFQTVELSKVKRLVLEKDRELSEKSTALKEVTGQLEKLRAEIGRLRRQEETLSDVQDISKTEIKVVKKNLENVESELDKSEDENGKLKISVDSEHMTNSSLRQVITKLEKELSEEKANSLNVQKTLTRVTSEKNTALLRNAEISQQMELVKQDMRRQEKEMKDLSKKMTALEDENASLKDIRNIEQKLNGTIVDLEEQLSEKNKTIKMLQLRLADLKKTLQQELRTPGTVNYHSDLVESNGTVAILQPSQTSHKNFPSIVKRDEEDVNFKYLKHVVIKFLTSREYEAQHLIKAISTLLKFSPEEEKLIYETLEWKKSWFGSKPKFSNKKSVSFAS